MRPNDSGGTGDGFVGCLGRRSSSGRISNQFIRYATYLGGNGLDFGRSLGYRRY
jgi:hypothetical protein